MHIPSVIGTTRSDHLGLRHSSGRQPRVSFHSRSIIQIRALVYGILLPAVPTVSARTVRRLCRNCVNSSLRHQSHPPRTRARASRQTSPSLAPAAFSLCVTSRNRRQLHPPMCKGSEDMPTTPTPLRLFLSVLKRPGYVPPRALHHSPTVRYPLPPEIRCKGIRTRRL
ncbi:hypothetical protein DFH09DRAFT_1147347 [Mycena vulgaris]|nr:hypothetical protein DFH09DRAFT_1147347 [Mycena vulgaris]